MHIPKYSVIILLIPIILYSCRTVIPVVQSPRGESDAKEYIEKYKYLAVSEMKRTGIPASITLAQGMIESDFGHSTLAREANNHFGIKCHDDWTGPVIRHHDDRRNECFRKYSRPEDSFYDHSDFLKSGSRYRSLFELRQTDYKAWAKGLKKSGYATNPDYANMLIRKIEENNLNSFDTGFITDKKEEIHPVREKNVNVSSVADNNDAILPDPGTMIITARVPRILENNRIQYIIVKEGETKEALEQEFQLLNWELPKYNELDNDFVPGAGQLLYLQPKRDKAEPGKEVHTVIGGDTMYYISQKYGVKIRKLYEYNRMSEGEEPFPGSKIWLRGMKPVN